MTCEKTDILKAVMKWIGHKNSTQWGIKAIFEHVRLDLVDRRYLVNEVVLNKGSCEEHIHTIVFEY